MNSYLNKIDKDKKKGKPMIIGTDLIDNEKGNSELGEALYTLVKVFSDIKRKEENLRNNVQK